MLTTENFASTQWCPMARQDNDGGTYNRMDKGDKPATSCNCIASACMAWRWADPAQAPAVSTKWIRHPEPTPKAAAEAFHGDDVPPELWPERPAHVPATWSYFVWDGDYTSQDNVWVEPKEEREAREKLFRASYPTDTRRGYCGAFGKPDHA